jgi:formylglycine-generating enzyme required for sulfatase activity
MSAAMVKELMSSTGFRASSFLRFVALASCLLALSSSPALAQAPSVDNSGGPSGITASSATLNGNLTSTGSDTNAVVTFFWGLTDGGTNPAAWSFQDFIGPRTAGLFSTVVTSLPSNTMFFYRSYASNAFGDAWAPSSVSFQTQGGQPPYFKVYGIPDHLFTGQVASVTVEAWTGANPWTNYMGTVYFSSTAGDAILPANYTFTAGDNGSHTFTNSVMFPTPEVVSYDFFVNDFTDGAMFGHQFPITVFNGYTNVATSLMIRGYTDPVFTGQWANVSVAAVAAQNPGELWLANTFVDEIMFSSSDASAVLPGGGIYAFSGVDQGWHSFSNALQFNTIGEQWLQVVDNFNTNLQDKAWNITVQGTSYDSNVTHFVIDGPHWAAAGQWNNFVVSARNMFEQDVTDFVGTVLFQSSDPSAIYPPSSSFSPGDMGKRAFTDSNGLVFNTTGTQWFLVYLQGNTNIFGILDSVEVKPSGSALAVSNAAATVVTANSATLNALVVDKGPGGSWPYITFYWGDVDGGTTPGAWANSTPIGMQDVGPVSLAVSNLLASTTYFYTIYATNNTGETWAPESTNFTTLPQTLTLTVSSAYGTPVPSGVTTNPWNSLIAASITDSPVGTGVGTQQVCIGWAGTGSAPVSGVGTNTTFNITSDSAITWNWQELHLLTASAGPGGSVTAAVNGWYPVFSNIMIDATASNGHHFAGWTGDVPPANTNDNPLVVTMDQARSVTANFAMNLYDITASPGPNGNITPPGTTMVGYGSNQVYTITPNTNYHIADVVADTVSQGVTNSYTFVNVTNGGHMISATFALDTFTLTVTSLYGVPTPAGLTTNNYNALINASMPSPALNGTTQYLCTGWTGTGSVTSGAGTNTSFNITNNSTLSWQWKTQFMWTAGVSGNGSVGVASGWQESGTNLNVTATASNGYHFVNWTGDIASTNNPLNVAMSQPYAVTANFAINTYDITASAGANGGIAPPGTTWVGYGSNQVYTITPNANYHVLDVQVDAASIGATNSYTFVNVTNGGHTINATFALDTFTLAVNSPHGAPNPAGTTTNNWNTPITASVAGSPVANGTTQYVCTGWTGTGSAPASGILTNTSFNITANSILTWQWGTNYWLNPVAGANGSINAGPAWVVAGSNVTIAATPTNSYQFLNWTGDIGSTNNPLVLTMNQAYAITANFAINQHTIVATAGANGIVSPNAMVAVVDGSNQVFTIIPNANYHVFDVLIDGASIGATNSYTLVNVTANHTIDATFAIDTYTLTVTSLYGAPIPAGVTTNNWNSFINASVPSPVANGTTQYLCTGWVGTGSAPTGGTTNNTSFLITTDSTLTWNWQAQYLLNAVAGVGGIVTVVNGWYDPGANVNLSATTNAGYHFGGWTGDVPAANTNDNPLILTMSQARAVTANFVPDSGAVTVTINPAQAVTAGAQWRLTTGADTAWHNSGFTLAGVSAAGNPYTVTFNNIAGWTTPQDITLTATNGITALLSRDYLVGSMTRITGGTYQMGIVSGSGGHQVTINDFYIDTRPVNVGEFQAFCTATTSPMPPAPPWGFGNANLPIVNVTWNEASAYANWTGKRLPTEAEYEYVMRSSVADQLYPWGNAIGAGNANYNNNVGQPTVAGTYPANAYGAFDIAGNVWEWCGDWYQSTLTGPATNPQGAGSGSYKVIRGGSYANNNLRLQCGARFCIEPAVKYVDTGFRCASDLGGAGGGATSGDANNNGIPDWWEQWYFGLTGFNGNSDSDGDGLKDWQEYRAGTDPTNMSSVLAVQAVSTNGGIVIRWPSAAGKIYTIERCSDLAKGFSTLTNNLHARPPTNTYTDHTPATHAYFYRVKVK